MSLIKLKNNALDNLTSFEGSASLGDMVFISSATASSSASIEFTLGDYKEYKFFFVNMQPSLDRYGLQFQFSTDSGSTYATTITSTNFRTNHNEGDTSTNLAYNSGEDLAQSTSFQHLTGNDIGNASDESLSGYMSVFNPSSTTYVKHFIATTQCLGGNEVSVQSFIAGYANTTSALTNIKFQMSPSANITSGKILMFGLN